VITCAFFVQTGKELKPVDHSTIKYMEFRKNLFIIPKALARMTETELHLRREELQVRFQRHLYAVADNY
jgi:septin family protein